jgi:hypothetical protein
MLLICIHIQLISPGKDWTALVISEMQIKSVMRHHFPLTRMTVIKRTGNTSVDSGTQVWRNWNPQLVGGIVK